MVAREFVTIVLGEPWLPTLPIVQAAAIAAIVEMPMMIIKGVLVRTGHIRIVGAIIGVQVALLLASIYPVYDTFGLAAVIYGKAIITGATLVVMMITLGRHIGVGVREYFAILIRPALGAALMVLALHAIGIAMGPGVILSLIVKVVAGAVVYGVVVLALWRLSGRPDGAERFVLDKASGLLAATGLKSRS
jgi:O-antigen/teichoic acid export membrane protein